MAQMLALGEIRDLISLSNRPLRDSYKIIVMRFFSSESCSAEVVEVSYIEKTRKTTRRTDQWDIFFVLGRFELSRGDGC